MRDPSLGGEYKRMHRMEQCHDETKRIDTVPGPKWTLNNQGDAHIRVLSSMSAARDICDQLLTRLRISVRPRLPGVDDTTEDIEGHIHMSDEPNSSWPRTCHVPATLREARHRIPIRWTGLHPNSLASSCPYLYCVCCC